MSVSDSVQVFVYQTLVADAGVTALVGGRVYDNVPADAVFPYVSFGPTFEITDDEECLDGEEHRLQIDIWARDNARLRPAKAIADAVKGALHKVTADLGDGYAGLPMHVVSKRVFLDPDGITAHGVVMVEIAVEL